jgi:hypothetical protein
MGLPRSRAAAAAAALTLTLIHPLAEAAACSVCLAGDPIYEAEGASAQQKGQFNAYIELRGWSKRSGPLPHGHAEEAGEHAHAEQAHAPADEDHAAAAEEQLHEASAFEENDSMRLSAFLSWTPLDRLTLTLAVPAAFNRVTEVEGEDRERLEVTGLGDVALNASAVLWRNREVLPGTWVEGRAFLKAPTGKSQQRTNGVVDKHVQAGTGSWDFGFGLAGTHRTRWGSAYASLYYRENTEGALDYEYGDVWLANAAFQLPLGHALGVPGLAALVPGVELNFRHAEKDVFRGQRFGDSGGSLLYVTPSLGVQLPWVEGRRAPSLRAAVQIPVTNAWLNGFQEEKEVWSIGLQIPL